MAKVGVLLSGCGVMDGSEIHEAVLTLLALDRAGAEVLLMAPDKPQHDVIDHTTGNPMDETRNVRVEAARIARGPVEDVAGVDPLSLDALILPGGFGAAKNLCSFAVDGADCTVDEGAARLIRSLHAAGKPMGFICIAPVIAARLLGATVTIGHDAATAAAIEAMGGKHEIKAAEEICIDEVRNVVSTPAYMCARRLAEAAVGIERLVTAVLQRAG